jgi:hypothetical protein
VTAPLKFDDDFIARHARDTKATTPILFFLTHDDEGRTHWQGFIYCLRKDGTGRARLFEWFMGSESDDIAFTKAFLSECTFYTSDMQMKLAARSGSD